METDASLETLIQQKDHLSILRYLRVHQLREPELAVKHGKAVLKKSLDEVTKLAVYEQMALAAIDLQNHTLAEDCISNLRKAGVAKDSVRFRLLLARCMESAGDTAQAEQIYDTLLKQCPANSCALKRKYCLLKSKPGQEIAAMAALNEYLSSNYADTSAWYEMAQLRMERGDYARAVYAFEEVLLSNPVDVNVHIWMAECYTTIGDLPSLVQARKHFCQALEFNSSSRRAQFGLVVAAKAYLNAAANATKKQQVEDFELEVAKELVRYGAEHATQAYKGTKMLKAVKNMLAHYTD